MERYVIEVEKGKEAADGRPSVSSVYRSAYCKDGFPAPPAGIESCWDIFTHAVQKHPHNPMLGQREIINGKAGGYKWLTYQEVYNMVLKIGSALRSCGVEQGGRCGIYGVNCPEWIVSMEACNAHGIYCVPLYDTLGADAVEFIIHHAEVSIAIIHEAKIPVILKSLPACVDCLKTLVSFGNISDAQREEAEKHGAKLYSWNDFLSLGEKRSFTLSAPKKTDICTIMYTSGTTGEPKGVLITNENIVTLVTGINHLLRCQDEELSEKDVYISFLPLAHIFDRVIEEYLYQRVLQ